MFFIFGLWEKARELYYPKGPSPKCLHKRYATALLDFESCGLVYVMGTGMCCLTLEWPPSQLMVKLNLLTFGRGVG